MILKSKTWKTRKSKNSKNSKYNTAQYKRIFTYLSQDPSESFEIYHNFKSKNDKSKAINEFYHNDSFRKKRKGGIAFYHEIMSLSKKDESHVTLDMLHSLASEYIRLRCPNGLAYAIAHTHGKNKHVHFILSATEVGDGGKNMRISKAQYQDIKVSLEKFQIDKFPQLENSIVHQGKENSRSKTNDVEKQTKKRTKKVLEKEKVSEIVQQAVALSNNIDDLRASLVSKGAELYFYRNKPSGVIFEGDNSSKKYRWKTIDIDKSLIDILNDKQIEKDKRLEQLKYIQMEKDLRIKQLNETNKLNNDKSINKGMER